jgi:NADH:ubiquinone oxidoreductase subunit K
MFLRQIVVNTFLCVIGFMGIIINRYNILLILISLEIIFLGLNLNFLLLSAFANDAVGQIISFFILTVVGAESAIGLAILIAYYRIRGNIKTIQYAYLRN